MDISLIWAMADNRLIGRDNDLPWRLPGDLKHFMATTMGKPVVMGRKTFASMPGALPGRANIVMTRDTSWQSKGAMVVHDLEAALVLAQANAREQDVSEIMIIGGAEIYAMALPLATRLHITRVHDEPAGDVFFPPFDLSEWQCLNSERFAGDEKHTSDYTIELYERKVTAS